MNKLENFIKFIDKLIETKFFGEILIKMEEGNIYIIKKTESIKL